MRRAATALLLAAALAGAPTAGAAPIDRPRALARIGDTTDFALAGDAALVPRARGRVLEIRSLPLSGANGRSAVFRFEAPEGARPSAHLEASQQRVAVVVNTEDESSTLATQAFAGPLAGPWEPLTELREISSDDFFPSLIQVDGANLFTTEARGDFQSVRFVVREPGADPRVIELPPEVVTAVFAGDLVAYAVPVDGQPADDEPRRVVVRDWRTGAQRTTAVIPQGIEDVDLRADGRVVLSEDGGGLFELRDGDEPKRLTKGGVSPAYVGDRIVFVRIGRKEGDERLAVVEPDRRTVRSFGVPTARIDGYDVDEARVLWRANGCLLVADASARAATAPGAGPCPRSELFLDDSGPSPVLDRSRRVPLTLRCIAAAPPGCRGTVRLRLPDAPPGAVSVPLRFTIAAGRSRRLIPRLTRRAFRAAIREARDGLGGAGFEVVAVAVDPAGRRSRLRDGYGVEVPRRLRAG